MYIKKHKKESKTTKKKQSKRKQCELNKKTIETLNI